MACSLESFEIRFGRADFCCAVGFRPHLGNRLLITNPYYGWMFLIRPFLSFWHIYRSSYSGSKTARRPLIIIISTCSLALSFEPISETIIIPLTALNVETCSNDLGCGRAINYVTSGNVRDSTVQINLLEKSDFDEFQKIGFAHFRLR